MSFVVYDETDSRLVLDGHVYKTRHGANQSAVAAIARRLKRFAVTKNDRDLNDARDMALNWTVVEKSVYDSEIRTTKKVKNLMTGKEIEIDVNTPRSCDPSSELYWSM